MVETASDVVAGSFLYRWLTAEPEPDVVVIDLRETYTVGPFIRLLDATVEWLRPYWKASALKRMTDACVRVLERAAATKAGRILASVLAPPEPPESKATPDANAGERADSKDDPDDERERPEES